MKKAGYGHQKTMMEITAENRARWTHKLCGLRITVIHNEQVKYVNSNTLLLQKNSISILQNIRLSSRIQYEAIIINSLLQTQSQNFSFSLFN